MLTCFIKRFNTSRISWLNKLFLSLQTFIFNFLFVLGFEGDIHLSTYPRTGTTWTQNILIGLWHGPDYLDEIGQSDMRFLFPYLEIYFIDEGLGLDIADKMETRPRFLKNHLPAYLAPREIFTHKRKNIVVLRNPKDTALSYYKFYQSEPTLKNYNPADNLEGFLESFLAGKVSYGNWWDWTKSWVDSAKLVVNFISPNFLLTLEGHHFVKYLI